MTYLLVKDGLKMTNYRSFRVGTHNNVAYAGSEVSFAAAFPDVL